MIWELNIVICMIKEREMERIGIFYGSSGGSTQEAAQMISDELTDKGFDVDVQNIADAHLSTFAVYDNIILGASTWGIEKLQDDWEDILNKLKQVNFSGKNVAFFGTGDQETYPDSFVDGIGVLYDMVTSQDAHVIGKWSTDGYVFRESKALVGGKFVGLALDYEVQPLHSEARIKDWADQITNELKNN